MKPDIFFLFVVLFHFNLTISRAQKKTEIFSRLDQKGLNQGEVRVIQDSALLSFLNFHLYTQEKINGIRGYRISIFRDTGQDARRNCLAVRSRFKNKYNSVACHETFVYPYYKLYAGDFRTESEALKFLKIVERDFPDAFIVRDIISFPDLK